MTHTSTTVARSKGNGGKRVAQASNSHAPVLVSGYKLALHFDVVRQHIDQLALQGVIERRHDGLFDQDVSRLKYFAHLRAEHRRSPRAEADGELARALAEWLRLRSAERMKELVPVEIYQQAIDDLAGSVLVALSGLPARLHPFAHDLAQRRKAEVVVAQVRRELAEKAMARAGALRSELEPAP
jgi:phage terminase Nu1 subunit (DNA packaging protein)